MLHSWVSGWKQMSMTAQADMFMEHARYLLEVGHCWASVWISPSIEDMNMGSQQLLEEWGKGSRVGQFESDSKAHLCTAAWHI